MAISASDVKALREKTGAGMMECKNALVETGGDAEQAEKLLKEKGLAAVEKRAGRATNEGRVFVKIADDGSAAALVEIASETDFVAKNAEFVALGNGIAERVLAKGYAEVNDELTGMVTGLATKIRENMTLRRIRLVKAGPGESLSAYVHGEGAIGVVVKLGAEPAEALANEEVRDLAYDLALHVSWANPAALSRDKVDPAFVTENEEIFRAQMDQDEAMKGKPAGVRDGILKGKINKLLKSICFLDQGFVKDEKQSVAQVLAAVGGKAGAKLSILDFVYFKVGAS